MYGVIGDYNNSDPGRVITNTPQGYQTQSLGSWRGEQQRQTVPPEYASPYAPDNRDSVRRHHSRRSWVLTLVGVLVLVIVSVVGTTIHDASGAGDRQWQACYDAHANTPADEMVSYCGRRP